MIPETMSQKTPQRNHSLAEQDEAKPPQSKTPAAVHMDRRSVRRSFRRQLDAWFLLVILLLGMGTILFLSNISASLQQTTSAQTATQPIPVLSATPVSTANVFVRPAQVRLSPFPH